MSKKDNVLKEKYSIAPFVLLPDIITPAVPAIIIPLNRNPRLLAYRLYSFHCITSGTIRFAPGTGLHSVSLSRLIPSNAVSRISALTALCQNRYAYDV